MMTKKNVAFLVAAVVALYLAVCIVYSQKVPLEDIPLDTLIETNAPSRAETANIVEAAISGITAETLGALVAETDTLQSVTERGATTTEAVTIGSRRVGAVGMSSLANGESVVASESYSHAEGGNTTASGYASHAEGMDTTASGTGSHAEGGNTTASGPYSHAEGMDTTASGHFSHAEGSNTTASGAGSHASGFNSVASNIISFAWQGTDGGYTEPPYGSHGPGTYNINPVGGASGFWIGETNLPTHIENALVPYAKTEDVTQAISAIPGADGIFTDIETEQVYHIVVSNGHWLIRYAE